MASYFNLILDTTPPVIQINAPYYTGRDYATPISVTANEALLNEQSFYIIDSQGIRHDIILNFSGNEFIGNETFHDFPIGIATMYAQLYDEVGNPSAIASKSINVISTLWSLLLNVQVSDLTRVKLNTMEYSRKVSVKDSTREISSSSTQ